MTDVMQRLRRAAERTREDLGPDGTNYPDVRVLLAFAEAELAQPQPQPQPKGSEAEVERLRELAATCYAGLGAECDLPEQWLDVLNAAANGELFTTDGLLPFTATQAPAPAHAGAAQSIASMVTEWVDGGIKMGTDWRSGLADVIAKRLARFQAPAVEVVTDAMVDRFLGWRLPEDFSPDGGVTFKPLQYGTVTTWPSGTNLLNAIQARAMLEFVHANPPQAMTREWCADFPGSAAGIINRLAQRVDELQAAAKPAPAVPHGKDQP